MGACFTDCKNDEFDPDDPYNLHKYCFTQLHLLGEPEIPVWSEDPKTFSTTHEDTLYAGVYLPFKVTVKEGTTPLQDALVCLWKEGDIYETQTTDTAGEAFFKVIPDSTGTLYVTTTRYNYIPHESEVEVEESVLHVDVTEISEVSGGTANFSLFAGQANANRNYILLGSVSGMQPGTPLPGGLVTLPLNWDIFTDFVLLLINSPLFLDFMGTLDGLGQGTAQINTPPIPGFAGTTMYYAYALNQPWDFASNPIVIEIVP
jgi:hypothetical protein